MFFAFEKSLNRLRSQMNESTNYEHKVANKFWITNSKKLGDCMFDFFGDEMQVTDFRTNPAVAGLASMISCHPSAEIRIWFWQMRRILSTSGLSASILRIPRAIFYASGTQNSVITFIRQKGNFNHVVSEELGVYILKLHYKGNDVSMFVLLLPFSITHPLSQDSEPQDDIRQLVERLTTEKGSQELRQLLDDEMPSREVEVNLPRFEIERELQLNQLLYALSAGELLSPGAADLRGFVADGEPSLHLGDAIHRARIEVTEEGTTAAAVIVISTFRTSRSSEPAIFNAIHPFVYLIYDKHDRTVLFIGIFRSPANSLASGAV